MNPWTKYLLALGVISLDAVLWAERGLSYARPTFGSAAAKTARPHSQPGPLRVGTTRAPSK